MNKKDDESIENSKEIKFGKPVKTKQYFNIERISHYYSKRMPVFDFALFATGIVIIIALGLPLIWIGRSGDLECCITSGFVLGIAGLIAIFAAISKYIAALTDYNSREDEKIIDEWTDKNIKMIVKDAVEKTGIEESEFISESIVMTGAEALDDAGHVIKIAKGRDNKLRFSLLKVTVLNLTQNQLIIFSCVLNLMTGKKTKEITEEYFFKDIVSIRTVTKDNRLYLNFNTYGGGSSSIFLGYSKHSSGEEIPVTSVEKAFTAIRKMIREKKSV